MDFKEVTFGRTAPEYIINSKILGEVVFYTIDSENFSADEDVSSRVPQYRSARAEHEIRLRARPVYQNADQGGLSAHSMYVDGDFYATVHVTERWEQSWVWVLNPIETRTEDNPHEREDYIKRTLERGGAQIEDAITNMEEAYLRHVCYHAHKPGANFDQFAPKTFEEVSGGKWTSAKSQAAAEWERIKALHVGKATLEYKVAVPA